MIDDSLTLPGTIPDLLRWCSPVRVEVEYLGRKVRGHGAVLSIDPGRREVVVAVHLIGLVWRSFDDIDLDLTDATGRAHAAWWLWSTLTRSSVEWCPSWRRFARGYQLDIGNGRPFYFFERGMAVEAPEFRQVAVDARLDELSPTEALRRVVLHVAGLS